MKFIKISCVTCFIFVSIVYAENKYSKEANVNVGKSNVLNEPEINIRTLEKPFRMAKLNLLWTKAQSVSYLNCLEVCYYDIMEQA